jgi:glycosyltransferase involved in cell wall biosynthesis
VRLLYWTETFWPLIGGVQNYAKQFIREMRKRGYEISVITVRYQDHPEEEMVDDTVVYRLPFHDVLRGRDPEAFVTLRRRIEAIRKDFGPDLVHVNLYGPSVALHVETNKRAPLPTVVALHQDMSQSGGFGTIVGRMFDQASWVTAVSAAALGDLKQAFPQIRDKSSVVYNGLVTQDFVPTRPPADPPVVLCVGRLVDEKGIDLALEAFAGVRETFPAARLVIAGDGPERTALEDRARRLKIGEAVDLMGWVNPEGVADLMDRSTVTLIPSRCRETFGLVAVESALMGRPVVATRVGGLEEVVRDGETCYLVTMGDAGGFARAIERVLADPGTAAELGTRARTMALQRFDIETNAASYDMLYRRLLGEVAA